MYYPNYSNGYASGYSNSYPMSYSNGYPSINPDEQKFDWMMSLTIGVSIFLSVVLMYIYWCYLIYRYRSDRVADKLLKKYKAINGSEDPPKYVEDDHKELAIPIATLNSAQTIASAQVEFRDKETHNVIEYIPFTATNKASCSPMDNSCISL